MTPPRKGQTWQHVDFKTTVTVIRRKGNTVTYTWRDRVTPMDAAKATASLAYFTRHFQRT